MPARRREDRVNALQREVEELRRSHRSALEEAEARRVALNRKLRKLARLGVVLPAPDVGLASSSKQQDDWKPITDVPDLPAGWEVGPPDFVGVGVQRAGTSWWFQMLSSHPRVHPPLPPGKKELHYLTGFPGGQMSEEDVDGYFARLPRPPGGVAGEWTPGYMTAHWVARLLAKIAPKVRVLVMLRDPLDRYRSALSYSGREAGKGQRLGASGQAFRSLYFGQLQRLLRHFPRDQILVQQYERCRAEPEGQLRRAWEFVGVDPSEAKMPDFSEQVGHKISLASLDQGVQEDLLAFWAEDLRLLAQEFPEIDLDLWPSARAAVKSA